MLKQKRENRIVSCLVCWTCHGRMGPNHVEPGAVGSAKAAGIAVVSKLDVVRNAQRRKSITACNHEVSCDAQGKKGSYACRPEDRSSPGAGGGGPTIGERTTGIRQRFQSESKIRRGLEALFRIFSRQRCITRYSPGGTLCTSCETA